jgi:hypothetical protein
MESLVPFDTKIRSAVAATPDGLLPPSLPLPNGAIMLGSKEPFPNPRRSGLALELGAATEKDSETGFISAPRWRMTPMVGLLIAWGVLTTILIVLLIYKSTRTMQEDDSIFLSETESQMEKDQVEILNKVNNITPMIKILGAVLGFTSGLTSGTVVVAI